MITDNETITVSANCMVCSNEDRVTVSTVDYQLYRSGALVQDVWPSLSAERREVIMGSRSGVYLCSPCWGIEVPKED